MKSINMVIFSLALLTSCNFSKSVKKDFTSGLVTKGDGLSCENVYLVVDENETKQNTFIYGQEFQMNFDNITGFKKEDGNVYPGMQIVVLTLAGDTVLKTIDLYGDNNEGLDLSPLMLIGTVTAASPINSGGEYKLYVNIWDKKEKGTFSGVVEFKVIPDEQIKIESNNVKYDEVYLYSKERGVVITNSKIKFNENTYLIFEGLSGFNEEDGMVFPGLKLTAHDDENNTIIEYDDLFSDYSESGLSAADLQSRVSAHFTMEANDFKNPLHLVVSIWDKKSDAAITATTELFTE